jgi:type VI protein secretion system component VasK
MSNSGQVDIKKPLLMGAELFLRLPFIVFAWIISLAVIELAVFLLINVVFPPIFDLSDGNILMRFVELLIMIMLMFASIIFIIHWSMRLPREATQKLSSWFQVKTGGPSDADEQKMLASVAVLMNSEKISQITKPNPGVAKAFGQRAGNRVRNSLDNLKNKKPGKSSGNISKGSSKEDEK